MVSRHGTCISRGRFVFHTNLDYVYNNYGIFWTFYCRDAIIRTFFDSIFIEVKGGVKLYIRSTTSQRLNVFAK